MGRVQHPIVGVQVGDGDGVDHSRSDSAVCRREREDLVDRCLNYLTSMATDHLPMPPEHKRNLRDAIRAVVECLDEVDNNDRLRHMVQRLEAFRDKAETVDMRMGPPWFIYAIAFALTFGLGWLGGRIICGQPVQHSGDPVEKPIDLGQHRLNK